MAAFYIALQIIGGIETVAIVWLVSYHPRLSRRDRRIFRIVAACIAVGYLVGPVASAALHPGEAIALARRDAPSSAPIYLIQCVVGLVAVVALLRYLRGGRRG